MPWVYSNAGITDYWYADYLSETQQAAAVTLPVNGAVTQLKVYAAGYNNDVSARVCIWYPEGALIAQSATFTVVEGGNTDYNPYTESVTATALTAGTYWVGLYRNQNTRNYIFVRNTGYIYTKVNTATFPSVSSMSGYDPDNNSQPYVGMFYITAPAAPTSASTVRNSDTSITFSWTNNTSADQPYTNLYLERYDNVTAAWYSKATLSSSAVNYTDTTVISNRAYTYRIRAYNAAGYSSYLTGSEINTTPAVPITVVATRSGANVVLTWSDESTNEDQFRIQKREYTGSWGAWGSDATVTANSEEYVDVAPYTYGQYRIRSEETGQSLYSAYVESNEVVTIAPPNAPTSLSPDNAVFDGTGSKIFTWLHNATDGTPQTKYSITYKVSGGSYPGTPQVNEAVSSTSSNTFAGATFTNNTVYVYKVKTWGTHATGSDWSAEATFEAVTTPVTTITSPTALANYIYSALTVTWTYTQAEGNDQTEYLCKLYDSNDVLLETQLASSTVLNGGTGTCTFDYDLSNTSTYKITLQVKEEKGLWSTEESVTFSTVFITPPIPVLTCTLNNDGGYVSLAIVNPNSEVGETDALYNKIYRSFDEGVTYELLQDNVPLNTTIVDYTPTLNGISYFVTAISAIPSSRNSVLSTITTVLTGYFFLNSGSNYEDYIKLVGDVSLTDKVNRATVTKKFEGREYSVKYQSTSKDQILTFSCDVPFDDYQTLINIIDYTGNLMYRDWYGRRFICNISDVQFVLKDNDAYQFSCTIEKVSTI